MHVRVGISIRTSEGWAVGVLKTGEGKIEFQN